MDALRQSPGSTIIIRWSRQEGTPSPGDEEHVLRGNVLDLSSHTVTPFAGLDSLLGIVRGILEKVPQSSRAKRRKWTDS